MGTYLFPCDYLRGYVPIWEVVTHCRAEHREVVYRQERYGKLEVKFDLVIIDSISVIYALVHAPAHQNIPL